MLTFCDGGKPQAVESLSDKSCLFSQMIKDINGDWYYKFNNSGIFEKNINDDVLNLTYWNIGMESFTIFTDKIITSPSISLEQTRKVLTEEIN